MAHEMWLIGVGVMALDYAKVMEGLGVNFTSIGRGEARASHFEKTTGLPVVRGGIENYLTTRPKVPQHAIISVGVEALKSVAIQLIRYGVKNILVEKPAGLNCSEIEELKQVAESAQTQVYVAYNRRFYASVQKAREIIAQDGGVTSFNFEFTEWSHEIKKLEKDEAVKKAWLLANSTHVIDMAFFLGGCPKTMTTYTAGGLDWHPAASVFAGAGITDLGAMFSYQANWAAPGRWGVEILTSQHRLIFRPLEKLHIQRLGSVAIEPHEIDDRLDIAFKPGLYHQVKNFIEGHNIDFCTIEDQCKIIEWYEKIAGY
jgi:predicted dehydrogenase